VSLADELAEALGIHPVIREMLKTKETYGDVLSVLLYASMLLELRRRKELKLKRFMKYLGGE